MLEAENTNKEPELLQLHYNFDFNVQEHEFVFCCEKIIHQNVKYEYLLT